MHIGIAQIRAKSAQSFNWRMSPACCQTTLALLIKLSAGRIFTGWRISRCCRWSKVDAIPALTFSTRYPRCLHGPGLEVVYTIFGELSTYHWFQSFHKCIKGMIWSIRKYMPAFLFGFWGLRYSSSNVANCFCSNFTELGKHFLMIVIRLQ